MKSAKFNSGAMVNMVYGTMVIVMVVIWLLNYLRPEWFHPLMWIVPLCFALSGRVAVMMCEGFFELPAGKVVNKMLLLKGVKLLATMAVMIICFMVMEKGPARNGFLIVLVGSYVVSTLVELRVFSNFEKANKARKAVEAEQEKRLDAENN